VDRRRVTRRSQDRREKCLPGLFWLDVLIVTAFVLIAIFLFVF
jgi:hypothetical protein